ncbi:MAG: lyase family protein, partial [Pseudomonadota bacterium]|nr:lyase family protein [Pseudomonadota bacterium]
AGAIPAAAAAAIAAACRVDGFDVETLVAEARSAGSLAIPLVRGLTARVAAVDAKAAVHVHHGSTSQDVIDTAMVLMTRRAMALLDADLRRLVSSLTALAQRHAATPTLARTLMQPAQVIGFGHTVLAWLAPLRRAQASLGAAKAAALQLQFGGAVGTLAALGDRGDAVAHGIGVRLGLPVPIVAWHSQRDAWVSLGCAVAVLCGSLGKIGRDLALLAQAEVAEVAEARQPGRGGSSAMPNKRNPVAALVAIAAATRVPQITATLLAAMPQEQQRGLGNWQAELAVWPSLFMATHGALRALADAFVRLEINAARMRANIEAQHGAVFAEALAALLAPALGKAVAAERVAGWVMQSAADGQAVESLAANAIASEPALASVDRAALAAACDIDAAAARSADRVRIQLESMRHPDDLQGASP